MDKRIGNQFRAVLFLFALVMFPVLGNISFSVGYFDLNGTQLKKVGAGVPFILEVTVTGNENVAEKPEIKQLNKFFYTAGGVQTSVQMINGIITAINRYSYQVRIDKPGTYELGPIEINHHGRMLRSKAFTITVIREQESTKKEVPDESEALISMSTNKEQCYTYEPVMLKMRIYARGDVQQVQPQLPETKGFSVSNPIGPTSGKTTLNGKEWDYHEIEMTLYPQTAGSVIIPAAICNYSVAQQARNQMEAMLQMFGGQQAVTKHMVSNALDIMVGELPYTKNPTKHVGTVSTFTTSVNQHEAQQGDAIVLKVKLCSTVDMSNVDLVLQNMPAELKQYHSNTSLQPMKKGNYNQTKTFEYIVQGLKPGKWIIPAQTFRFFNTKTEQYQTRKTKPISLIITPGPLPQVGSHSEDGEGSALEGFITNHTLIRNKPSSVNRILFWYILSLILVILLMITYFVWIYSNCYYEKNYLAIRKNIAFYKANSMLKYANREREVKGLHALFVELVSALLMKSPNEISSDDIEAFLESKDLNERQVEEWHLFYSEISQAAYNNRKEHFAQKSVVQHLLLQSRYWIDLFRASK